MDKTTIADTSAGLKPPKKPPQRYVALSNGESFDGTLAEIQDELDDQDCDVGDYAFYELGDEVVVEQIKELKITLKKVR